MSGLKLLQGYHRKLQLEANKKATDQESIIAGLEEKLAASEKASKEKDVKISRLWKTLNQLIDEVTSNIKNETSVRPAKAIYSVVIRVATQREDSVAFKFRFSKDAYWQMASMYAHTSPPAMYYDNFEIDILLYDTVLGKRDFAYHIFYYGLKEHAYTLEKTRLFFAEEDVCQYYTNIDSIIAYIMLGDACKDSNFVACVERAQTILFELRKKETERIKKLRNTIPGEKNERDN